jgi:hypothetical protein
MAAERNVCYLIFCLTITKRATVDRNTRICMGSDKHNRSLKVAVQGLDFMVPPFYIHTYMGTDYKDRNIPHTYPQVYAVTVVRLQCSFRGKFLIHPTAYLLI